LLALPLQLSALLKFVGFVRNAEGGCVAR